jgi:hypothetical protein
MDISTLSSEQTPGRTALESGINNGQWYNSVYDKLHNIAVTSSILKRKMVFEPIFHYKADNQSPINRTMNT